CFRLSICPNNGHIILVLSLFPCLSGVHRYLPSFPTRRSSDLPQRAGPDRRSGRSGGTASPPTDPGRRAAGDRWTRRSGSDGPRRSEEHTSELQSRENVVCRLLLEKKMKDGLY